jgi:transcriptional regulator with XRE-family HTH domain
MQRFGEKLRLLRKHRKMTLKELAETIGYTSHSYISEVETGKLQPSLELALKVSRLFDVSLDQLLKDELEVEGEGSG